MNFFSRFRSVGGRASSMMQACSACAGDYEDPDRTAREADVSGDAQERRAQESDLEEFPAEK